MRNWILGLVLLIPATGISQTEQVPADLNGVWLLINDRGQPSYIAFSSNRMAIYRGRLSTVQLNNSKQHSDAGAEAAQIEAFLADETQTGQTSDRAAEIFIERLDLPDMDQETRAAGTREVSEAFRKRLRDRLERLRFQLQDASTNGDGTLTRHDVTLSSPADYSNEIDERRVDVAVSGDRLYLTINQRVWAYDRTSALTGEARAEWDRRGNRGFKNRLEDEYDRLFTRCVSLQRNDRPVEDCRAYRDRMAQFGVELRPEFVLERYRDFDKPSDTEMAFWKNQLNAGGTWTSTFPALEYCFDGHSTKETRDAFTDRLAANRFRNTLWRMTILSNAPGEKPRNWTQEEYMAWAGPSDQMFGSRQGAAYLRADGVLGFGSNFEGLRFDPRDRWTYENGELHLSWHDGTFEAHIPVRRNGQSEGATNFALGKYIYLDLVLGNYDLLTKMAYPQSHPDYDYLLPFAERNTCDGGSISTSIAENDIDPAPEIEWPTRAPGTFPAHWFARTEMSDGSQHSDEKTRDEMQHGGFYHLNDTGVVGVNIKHPAGYGYDKSARWTIDGPRMTWTWDGWDTFVFELPTSYDAEISAVGQKNQQYRMVLTPTDLLEPGTRRRADPANAIATVPERKSAPAGASPAERPPAQPEQKVSLAGCWRWSNGANISLREDGTAVNEIVQGTWRAVPYGYEITWPPIEDAITLARDGRSFDGVGAFGIRFSAARVGQGTGLAGRWQRQDGVVLEFAANGTAASGALQGQWSGSGNKFRVAWPLIDAVTMSSDGEHLDVINQFGQVTAKRQPGC